MPNYFDHDGTREQSIASAYATSERLDDRDCLAGAVAEAQDEAWIDSLADELHATLADFPGIGDDAWKTAAKGIIRRHYLEDLTAS